MNLKAFFEIISESGIKSGLSVLSTSTKAFLGIGTAISVVSTAYSIYQQQQEELIRNTQKAASTFDESNNSIQEQINKYKELKSCNKVARLFDTTGENIRQILIRNNIERIRLE